MICNGSYATVQWFGKNKGGCRVCDQPVPIYMHGKRKGLAKKHNKPS